MLNRMEGADANTESSEVNKGEKESTYKIPFNMEELESLIDSALNEMDFGGMVKSTFADLNTTLKTQDSEFIFRFICSYVDLRHNCLMVLSVLIMIYFAAID